MDAAAVGMAKLWLLVLPEERDNREAGGFGA